MTKPVVTLRNTKGSALDYTELDTNFSNLRDATITVTDGTNSKAIDLNGTITFTAAGTTSIGVNPSTGEITITGTGAGTINSGASGALSYYSGAGTTLDDTKLIYSVNSGDVRLALNTTGTLLLGNANGGINLYPSSGSSVSVINGGLGTEGTINVNLNTTTSTVSGGYNAGSILNNGTTTFLNQAGLLIVQNTTTGNVALWLCGGASAVKVSDSLSNTSGSVAYYSNAGDIGYRHTNTTGSTQVFTFMWLQTSATP